LDQNPKLTCASYVIWECVEVLWKVLEWDSLQAKLSKILNSWDIAVNKVYDFIKNYFEKKEIKEIIENNSDLFETEKDKQLLLDFLDRKHKAIVITSEVIKDGRFAGIVFDKNNSDQIWLFLQKIYDTISEIINDIPKLKVEVFR